MKKNKLLIIGVVLIAFLSTFKMYSAYKNLKMATTYTPQEILEKK